MALCKLRLIMYRLIGARIDAKLLIAAYDALVHILAAECLHLHLVVPELFLELFELPHVRLLTLPRLGRRWSDVGVCSATLTRLDPAGATFILGALFPRIVEAVHHVHAALRRQLSLRLVVDHAGAARQAVRVGVRVLGGGAR